jgi:hypothetical protein
MSVSTCKRPSSQCDPHRAMHGGARGESLTTQFILCRVLHVQGLCARDGRVLEAVLRCVALALIDGLGTASAAERVADRHRGRVQRAAQGGCGNKWGGSMGWRKVCRGGRSDLNLVSGENES